MKKCPYCGCALTDDRPTVERCSSCGVLLGAPTLDSSVMPTIDSVPDSQPPSGFVPTIDSEVATSLPNIAPTIDSKAGAITPQFAPTIDSADSGVLSDISSDKKPPLRSLENRFAPTLDSADNAATQLGSATGSGGAWIPGGAAALPATGRRSTPTPYDPTLDSDAAAADDEARVASIWGKSLAGASPITSLRGSQDGGTPPRSVQTIHERAIGPVSDPTAPGADYQIVSVLGEGGMGVVYSARQSSIDREVAVKMLKPDLMINPRQREKFLSEAVVTGDLEHPGIVPIYDMGLSRDGSLFYSMKKIQGTPWSKAIRKNTLPENLDILLKVSDAVAFAHSRDVVHRDLKPDNVMVGEFGEVLVVDWGLAVSVATDPRSPSVARATSMGGTPAYMAPEMAIGPFDRIGKASDIYLLGAILFECITGKMPHFANSTSACLAAAGRNEIVATNVTGELMDIALHAMAARPEDRFESVRAFQQAIREYQSHTESIVMAGRAAAELESARSSDDYRDYSRALFGFEEARDLWSKNTQAIAGVREARLAYAGSAQRKGDFDLALSLLTDEEPDQVELRRELLAAQQERDARLNRLRTARRVMLGLVALVFLAVTSGIVLVSIQKAEADRLRVVAEDNEGEAKRQAGLARDNEREANRQTGIARDNAREALRLKGVAEDQRKQTEYEAYIALVGLAAAKIEENAFDRAVDLLEQCPAELRNWEWGRLMFLCRQGVTQISVRERVECVSMAADGKSLATGSRDGAARLWNTGDGKMIAELKLGAVGAYVASVAIAPTQLEWIAVGSNAENGWLRLWKPSTGEERLLRGHRGTVCSAAFSRDGSRLLTGSHDNTAILWDVARGNVVQTFRGHDWHVNGAAFSPDEKSIVTASRDGTVRLWNIATGQPTTNAAGETLAFAGHRGAVYSAAFSPDGQWVASCGYDKRVLLWKPAEMIAFDFKTLLSGKEPPVQRFIAFEGHLAAVRSVAFSRDGTRLLSASHDNSIKIWQVPSNDSKSFLKSAELIKTLRGHHGLVSGAVFYPGDDNLIASGSHDGFARVWNIKNYEEQRALPGVALQGHEDAVLAARFSLDGNFVLTASRDRTAKAWRTDSGDEVQHYREGHTYLATRAVFYPNGKSLLTAGMDGTLRTWDVETGAERFAIVGAGHTAAVAISPDAKHILGGLAVQDATGDDATRDHVPRAAIWNAADGNLIFQLAHHKTDITAAAFSADAALAYTGDTNGRGNLWNAATGEHLAKLTWHTAKITAAVFLAKEKKVLVTASADGTVCPWDVTDPQHPRPLEMQILKHGAAVTAMSASADGQTILTGSEDGVARRWRLDQPDRPRTVALPPNSQISAVALAAQSRGMIVDAARRVVWFFDASSDGEAAPTVQRFLDLAALGAPAWSGEFSPDGQSVVTIGGDEARLWDLQGQEIMRFDPHRSVAAANYSPNGKQVVTAGWDNSARIWDAATGQTLLKLAGGLAGENGPHTAPINSAIFSSDGGQVLTASDDGSIKLWDASSGRVIRNFVGHGGSVKSAVFSMDGKRIVSASADGTARIWNVESSETLRELKGRGLAMLSAVFSVDGQWVITGGEDNTAIIWNAQDGSSVRTLKGHTAAVTSVAITADRSRVLTGSADQTAKLWDASNGKEILTLKGHNREVTSVEFSEDQSKVLTASRDGTAIVWLTTTWRQREPAGHKDN